VSSVVARFWREQEELWVGTAALDFGKGLGCFNRLGGWAGPAPVSTFDAPCVT
jgi:hypothetical protein